MTHAEYLNQTVFARISPSPIHGVGVFAIRDIPEGIRITDNTTDDLGDTFWYIMGPLDFAQVLPEIQELVLDRMLFDEEERKIRFLSPNRDAILRSFMNHSDTPNSDGEFATRYIKKGEEITEDFRTLFEHPHPLTAKHHAFLWPNSEKSTST